MTLQLTIGAADGTARAGTVTTPRGTFRTPCFMPVGTRGSVRTLSSADLEDLGVEVMLANTYHLMLRPGATPGGAGAVRDRARRHRPVPPNRERAAHRGAGVRRVRGRRPLRGRDP